MRKLELLAPAKNLLQGKLAVDAGADAVYIGGPKFGARSQAGNSLDDIATLIEYAHIYAVKVFVAINTILYDYELKNVEIYIHKLYKIGVDAIIIQDMGILEMDLPLISLHASTQTNNASLEKIKFLQNVGFSRVVLARELSINDIQYISQNTDIEIEAFIHGALCVSYSGQCYLSQYLAKRSGNRGECIQACRNEYTLVDNKGRIIAQNKHLLSPKDFNATDYLQSMIEAGVQSFKIEGRLKDAAYVVNTVAWYREQLDKIISKSPDLYCRASAGKSYCSFVPDLQKTFNRGFTSYFLNGRETSVISPNTPKAIGHKIGKVIEIRGDSFKIQTTEKISNGDGLCFFTSDSQLNGFRVNKVVGEFIYPAQMPKINLDQELYRNNDIAFERLIDAGAAQRYIFIDLALRESEAGIVLDVVDEDGLSVFVDRVFVKDSPKNSIKNKATQELQLRKTGDTCFKVSSCNIDCDIFLPISVINDMRREALLLLASKRLQFYKSTNNQRISSIVDYPDKNLAYTGNVSNSFARRFYQRHGVVDIAPAYELNNDMNDAVLMTTKHCLRYDYQLCPIHCKNCQNIATIDYPLWLCDKENKYKLDFDCKNCVMKISTS